MRLKGELETDSRLRKEVEENFGTIGDFIHIIINSGSEKTKLVEYIRKKMKV